MSENKLIGRGKVIFNLIPNATNLLDIGCASGYDTKYFLKKAEKVYAVDCNKEFIDIAKRKYPKIDFKVSFAENLPFNKEMFDVVVLGDVLEHVNNEEKILREIYRVLKKKGYLILSVPNKGLFSFLDPDNFYINFPRIHNFLYRIVKKGKFDLKKEYHRHYSVGDIKNILGSNFDIIKIKRNGLIVYPIVRLFEILIERMLKKRVLIGLFDLLKEIDYKCDYGRFGYGLALIAKKT